MNKQEKQLFDEEYVKLKKFVLYFSDRFMGLEKVPEHVRPAAILQGLEQTSPAKAKKGLLMAVNDAMEISSDWSPEKVAALDVALKSEGAAPLTELRRRYSKRYLSLLKRGLIRNEQEYYFIKGIIDGGSIEQGATETEKLYAMLNDFETRPALALKKQLT